MKTNRRKYRTFSRHGDFLFTKREANKRNRKDAKKMLTNIAQYVIISISNEREVINMTVKELRAVLKLAVDENAEILFSTEPGVAFGIHGFDDSEEEFLILLDTIEWENRVDSLSTLWYTDYSK